MTRFGEANTGMRPLLVGEANPYGADPEYALYPFPRNAAGHRLTLHLKLTDAVYLRTFDRVNLLVGGKWSIVKARASAQYILADRIVADRIVGRPERPLILLGAKVAEAFGVPYKGAPLIRAAERIAVLPHPSGRCMAWNDPRVPARAREVVGELVPGLFPAPP